MLEIKYYKDYRHNYLILKDNGCLSENIYQRKMITENKMKGMLCCQERFINGEILLYYEITSRQSLFSIYDGKRIGMEQLRKFFLQLKLVNDLLEKYLLDAGCLILQPEYIFQDIETGEYSFLYYPDPEEAGFSRFLDFLMERVDNEDTDAVETVYRIADLVGREQFVLDEVLKWFQDDATVNSKKQRQENSDAGMNQENELSFGSREQENAYESLNPLPAEGEKKKRDKAETLKKLIPIWGAGLLGVCLLLYLKMSYELSYQEETYVMLGLAGLAVMMAGLAVWFFYACCFQRAEKEQKMREREEEERYIFTGEDEILTPASEAGNTVYIPWAENCENKLYSMDRKNKCHIDLGRLPLTVGKLAGAVDMVINEKSISRMHAKFSRTGSSVYITDLNSTNGTFRNGMRLLPNASEIIEPGDEIRLGKLKFIYR